MNAIQQTHSGAPIIAANDILTAGHVAELIAALEFDADAASSSHCGAQVTICTINLPSPTSSDWPLWSREFYLAACKNDPKYQSDV